MAARTPTRLWTTFLGARATALYTVPTVTTGDTCDIGSTGTGDFSKVFFAMSIPDTEGTLAGTELTAATNLTISNSSLTGESVLLLVIGAPL